MSITVDGEEKWLDVAIDTDSTLLQEVDVDGRRGVGPAAAFLRRLAGHHAVASADVLVDAGSYLTALARHECSGHLEYTTQNHIETWFQTVAMRIDRFHAAWRGSPTSARR